MKRSNKSKTLRPGFTTGACAAAAARAATISLLEQRHVELVQVKLRGERLAEFRVKACTFDRDQATCSVIKDAGDDPDVTHGAEIAATVFLDGSAGVEICGGEGVGIVTKPGLEVPVGSPAINPVPRQMITTAVMKAAEERLQKRGFRVVISVPEGERLALKTLNPRLGIVGGISIIGTTGTVIPYSVSAYTACIAQSLDVAKAVGLDKAVLTTGRRSEKFAQAELGLPEESYILAGDFVGFSLRQCAQKGLTDVVVWGMIGKITKLACGHMYTNISDSRVDVGFMVRVAVQCGIPQEIVETIDHAVTANQFRKLMPAGYLKKFCDALCWQAGEKCRQHVAGRLNVECIMTDPDGIVLGRSNVTE